MQANLYSHTGSSIKISGWSGVRFSVRFPVFVLLMVVSKIFLCRQISFDILVDLHINFSRSGVRFSVRFPVFVLLMVVSKYFYTEKFLWYLLQHFCEIIVLKRIFRLVIFSRQIFLIGDIIKYEVSNFSVLSNLSSSNTNSNKFFGGTMIPIVRIWHVYCRV